MEFDVTNLDKVLLIKTLYVHADPKGRGIDEYNFLKDRGLNVIGLTDYECNEILNTYHPGTILIDYLKGKPIKLSFSRQSNGQIFVSSTGYDCRNGRYRFLEALLNVFDLDEILIIKKGYSQHLNRMIDDYTHRPIEETMILQNIVKHTKKHTDNGSYWTIDSDIIDYKPPFMREI